MDVNSATLTLSLMFFCSLGVLQIVTESKMIKKFCGYMSVAKQRAQAFQRC